MKQSVGWRVLLLALLMFGCCQTSQSWMDNPKRLLDPTKVVYAINCGSDQPIQSEHGFVFQPDQYFGAGEFSTYAHNDFAKNPEFTIRNTRDTKLHLNERLGNGGYVEYKLPIEFAGDYVLILLFAELNFEMVQDRAMRILIGSYEVIPEFDIVRTATPLAQVGVYLPFSVNEDGSFLYRGQRDLPDGIIDQNKLHLTLERIFDNPKIDGIVLFKGTLEETNYAFINQVNREEMVTYGIIHNRELVQSRIYPGFKVKEERMKRPKRIDRSVIIRDTEDWEEDVFIFEIRNYIKQIAAVLLLCLLIYFRRLFSLRSSKRKDSTNSNDEAPAAAAQTQTQTQKTDAPKAEKPKPKFDDKMFGLKPKTPKVKKDQ